MVSAPAAFRLPCVLGLPPTLHGVAVGSVQLLAIGLAGVWLIINLYHYGPLAYRGLAVVLSRIRSRDTAATPWPETDPLPTIDLLLPAYDEARVIEQAIRSIHDADYPTDQLRIHIITEPEDETTRRRLWDLLDRYDFRLHRIPADYPGRPNKPRALDYGFSLTDGDIVGVVDAEDLVAPELFRAVAAAFDDPGCDYALGHLDMANEDDGWLNLLFRAEYGFWYDLIVPAFADARYPIPLGGTTCFFRREALDAIAARRIDRFGSPWSRSDRAWLRARGLPERVPWDPHNVTEDFELGLFLWEEGFDFTYLDVTTREESPIDLTGWLTQRTRWQKGKILTFRQYLDAPPRGLKRRFHLYWQSLLPHLGPLNLLGIIIIFWLSTMAGLHYGRSIGTLLGLALAFAGLTMLLFMIGYWRTSDRPRSIRVRRMIVVGLSLPLYWLLQWFADLRALLDLSRGRLDWHTSVHFGRHFDTTSIDAQAYVQRPSELPALPVRTRWLGLGGIVLLGATLRLYALDRWSLWNDELYTVTERAVAPLPELIVGPGDPHPPVYFLLARGWMALVGSDPTAMRLLSIGFSLGSIVAIYGLGRAIYDDRTGLIAALLLASSTAHIHFGRMVRMYSLFTLLAALSWYAYVRLRTDELAIPWLVTPSRWTVAGYVVATLALLYTHVYGLFVVASQYACRWLSDAGRIPRRRWRLIQAVIVVGALPLAVHVASHVWGLLFGTGVSSIAWIPAPGFGVLRETLLLHAGYPDLYPIHAATPAAWVAVTGVSFVFNVCLVFAVVTIDADDERRYFFVGGRQAGLLAIFLLATIGLPFLLSYFVPIYVARYTIVAGIPLLLLVARGLVNLRDRRWRWVFLAVILCGAAIAIGSYYSGQSQEDWRGIASRLEMDADRDDLLVVQPTWVDPALDYYGRALPANRYRLRADGSVPQTALRTLTTRARGHRTVWLVTYDPQASPAVVRQLQRSHTRVETIHRGAITIHRFERRSADAPNLNSDKSRVIY